MRGIFGKSRSTHGNGAGTFLARLGRDTRGNMLAIMAAALIPFCGLVGGGIDLSRMYITKTRLQHACDAGALAGRKAMGSGEWGADDNAAAMQYFNANFTSTGMYGGSAPTVAFTENAGKVTGTASATLPMTLMRVLGKTTETLPVTCDADMRLPNTDVMFVLDTTGSMGDTPVGDTMTKIESLKVAVKCFYEIVAKLDTDATCTTGVPSGGTGGQVQVRFGFVPYATNVNVGKLLNPAWFANSRTYQTRVAQYANTTSNGPATQTGSLYNNLNPQNNWANQTDLGSGNSTWCDGQAVPADSGHTGIYPQGNPVEYNTTGSNPGVTTWATYQYGYFYTYRRSYSGGRCYIQRSTTYADLKRLFSQSATTSRTFSGWRYAPAAVDVSQLKNGSGWNSSFQWPIAAGGANKTINWDGCVEERQTVSQASYSPIPSDAKDLDIDTPPDATDATTQWGMVLPDLIYTRRSVNWTTDPVTTTSDYPNGSYYACPVESRLLQTWSDPVAFDNYVNQFTPQGNTYHDIGLLWGARLISPTGIFASTNALTPRGGEIDRNIIFMTDGDPCTGVNNYTAYGVNWFDRRQTDPSVAPTDGCTTTGSLTAQVNARTDALCTAIKNKNITLWVITFGYVDPRTVTRLTACATTSRYYSASNSADLQATFASIANQISQLRLTK